MPFNGSGTFVPPSAPTYPAVDGTTIMASQFNDALTDVYTGLTTCLTRDGQGVPSANLPMNGYKHTGAAAGTATGQYLSYGQSSASLATLALSATTATLLATATAAGDLIIGNSTSDGADNRRIVARSGGALSSTRGAFMVLAGNEDASNPGRCWLGAGIGGDFLAQVGGTTFMSCDGTTTTLSLDTTLSSTKTFIAGNGSLRAWTSSDTDIDSLITGTQGGTLLEGQNTGHLTLGIRSNDANDGFQVISKSAFGASYDLLAFEVKANGNGTLSGNFTAGGNIASSGTGTFTGAVTAASFSGVGTSLTALNASNLSSGTVAAARLSAAQAYALDAATVDSRALGYRDIPATVAAAWENGRCREVAAGVTLNTSDMVAGYVFCVYNDSAAGITITQGAGVTLRLAGTATTGNRTLAQRGWATIRCKSGTEAVIMGSGVS